MNDVTAAPLPSDPKALIRSREYRGLLVLAALVGLLVSCASWLFLEAVHEIEIEVYENLPHDLGYEHVPLWWPLPWLALAGLLTAFAIVQPAGARRACAGGRAQGRRHAARADRPAGCSARSARDARAWGWCWGRRRR